VNSGGILALRSGTDITSCLPTNHPKASPGTSPQARFWLITKRDGSVNTRAFPRTDLVKLHKPTSEGLEEMSRSGKCAIQPTDAPSAVTADRVS